MTTKKDKTKILLVWVAKVGKFQKFFLTPSCGKEHPTEEHYTAEMPTGEWM